MVTFQDREQAAAGSSSGIDAETGFMQHPHWWSQKWKLQVCMGY